MHNPAPQLAQTNAAGHRPDDDSVAVQGGRSGALYLGSDVYRRAAFGANHPLKIMRHSAVFDLVNIMGWLPDGAFRNTEPATVSELLEFHDRGYLEALQYAESEGRVSPEIRERYHIGTLENPLFEGLFERASMTVGGSILAARLASQGYVAFHPSGGTHHGRPDRASGFCYFNDPVFAILEFLKLGRARVLYVDLDAHHGDGVEAAFLDDPRVMTLSIHEADRWPHTGVAGVSGAGAVNLPVPKGVNDSELGFLMDEAVLPLAGKFSPQAVVVCCGADCLAGDPLSGMLLSNTVLWQAVDQLLGLDVPAVILGGGGYNPWTVARYWAGLWARISGREIPARLPAEATRLLETMECDLVDEEDVAADWLVTMADSPYPGPVREPVKSVARLAVSSWPAKPEDEKNGVA